jgi:hypothetical protein
LNIFTSRITAGWRCDAIFARLRELVETYETIAGGARLRRRRQEIEKSPLGLVMGELGQNKGLKKGTSGDKVPELTKA